MNYKMNPICKRENMLLGDGYRISILSSKLIRLEEQPSNCFTDSATQCVWNRDFPQNAFSINREGEWLVVETEDVILRYNEKGFASMNLSVYIKDMDITWNYGDVGWNLLGTARTLDEADGAVLLSRGLFSKQGYAFFDDGKSCELEGNTVKKRENPETDIYLWCYGRDFKGALKDFYYLTGQIPMIPRYALGNWWSRFHKYSESEYLELIDDFEKENIPLSVAVIDMDWHVTKVDPMYGSGWTGYTWNEELFPDYRRFLAKLKEKGLATTLNIHPADGVRAFEVMYPAVAKRMGIDPATKQQVEFDLTNPDFVDVYFEEILNPYEDEGVDFWWIDWQQGENSKIEGLDPLWLLNHYQYLDQLKRNKRAMIFSRYAGIGSHRYPIGFSGDTYATWKSLDFQPMFTTLASNIGFGCWSHDIGGHMHGKKDMEMFIRWVQFGVFSPIMRLHSTDNPFFAKEPWKMAEPYRTLYGDLLRLRHRMIPYIYTCNYEASRDSVPMIRPIYYDNPKADEAFDIRNGYYFGSNLLVGAITEEIDKETQLAAVDMYIPEGRWYDLFTKQVYTHGGRRKLYRPLGSIPVLLKAGAIVPMAKPEAAKSVGNPEAFDIYVGAGADGYFSIYEDDGISNSYMDGAFVNTGIKVTWHEDAVDVEIEPACGDLSLIPKEREYTLHILGVENQELVVELGKIKSDTGLTKRIENVKLYDNDCETRLFELLDQAWMDNDQKARIFDTFRNAATTQSFMEELRKLPVSERLKDAISELL